MAISYVQNQYNETIQDPYKCGQFASKATLDVASLCLGVGEATSASDAAKADLAVAEAEKVADTAVDVGKIAVDTADAAVNAGVSGAQTIGETASISTTPTDLYTFGNATVPRGARPINDFVVADGSCIIGPEAPPLPAGASSFADISNAPLKGHYYRLPAGTELPEGISVIADGVDVLPTSTRAPTHFTFYPTNETTTDLFNQLFKSLPWEYKGKKP